MPALETAVVEAAQTWEQDGIAHGAIREVIGGVDETFLQRMLLVLQDLATGSLLGEDVADDRTFATWHAVVEARLKALGTEGFYVVSDRAKALIQLAEQGLECLSLPDFFHCMHALVKSDALAIGQRVRHAHQELTTAKEVLARGQRAPYVEQAAPEATALVEAKPGEGTRWEEAHSTSRGHLETLSLPLPPFRIADSAPQTSAQVESQLTASVEAIESFAQRHQLPARPAAITKVRQQVPALAALVDVWWQGVHQALAPCVLSPRWRRWIDEALLPLVYWEHHAAHTRCVRRQAKIVQTLEAVRAEFEQHAITQCLSPQVLADWQAWATDRVQVFQRTSSAVEGRNGYRSQMHHNHRGLPRRRYKVWTILHHFDCRATDGTTPAARFFRWTFPDLFATVVSPIEALPQPRRRKHQMALCSCSHESVPL